jgi:uncharacterized 2Fe-2S/4Fe-4S cluster protein (DUF4445 family)
MPDPRKFKLHFLPNDKTIEVEAGETILQAAHKAGVYINSICGGDGVCGKCKVIVDKGRVESTPTTLLTRDEIQKNYVLACESRVASDLQILIPEETRLEGGKILGDEVAERFSLLSSVTGEPVAFRHDPLIKKLYLPLKPPTMDDNMPDYERVYNAILSHESSSSAIMEMQPGYRILRQLPSILREANWRVTATVARRRSIAELVQLEKGDTSRRNYGVAIDVGTTTIIAHLVDLTTSEMLDVQAKYNSQMRFGEDYIARIMYAVQNNALSQLQAIVVEDINGLIQALVTDAKVSLNDVTAVLCSGNTAMLHFLLGLDPSRIRSEPYLPTANFIPPIRAAEVGIRINSRGLLYCLPSVAAYVGSDITAGATAIRLDQTERICLFVDIGTNGEVVLGNKHWMVCCSCSAGPAFEGSGVKHGMRAARGAIEKLTISRDGRFTVEYETIGHERPLGICGSGLLDCLAEMFRAGVLDRSGTIQKGVKTKRIREAEGVPEFMLVPKEESGLDTDIVITQHDIRNLMRSKAAVFAAISVLVQAMNMQPERIEQVYLAGGFGNYLGLQSAITIGMLPDIPTSRIKFVGNTSARGAVMALLSNEAFDTVEKIASQMTYFDLMGNTRFMEEFVSANFLPHTRLELFPTVQREIAALAAERRGVRLPSGRR